jgi:hypothetical protein
MSDRTFIQHALGTVGSTTTIVAKIDGQIVFSGEVNAAAGPWPTWPDYEYVVDNPAYSWSGNSAFQGSIAHEVTVTSGTLLLADTVANNPLRDPDVFGRLDNEIIDDTPYSYPYVSEVRINDQVIAPVSDAPWQTGQGWHELAQGDVLVATINVVASRPAPPPPPPDEEPAP